MIKSIELEKIVSDDNRKYTKDDGFEQLVESIKQYGIIEQPVVRALEDGRYKVIAGRRRIAAAKKLGIAETECAVYGEEDPGSDEEIALAENVNRLEMHPLDEAALFYGMSYMGKSVEEIAKYYARSPSAIYKRLRLVHLIEELKGFFRDGHLDIAGAAILAELPEEDQKEFFNSHKDDFDPDDEDDDAVNKKIAVHIIHNFIYKKQKNTIEESMKSVCAGCGKRTHNEDNALFKDYEQMNDVCLDGECYRAKWYGMVRAALEAVAVQMSEAGLKTDDKIFFAGGVPERIYKGASKARFNIDKKDIDFEVIRQKDYEIGSETNRKKDACWKIETDRIGHIKVKRIICKERPPKEKREAGETGAGKGADKGIKREIENYGREALEAAAQELQIPSAAEMVKKLKDKNIYSGRFESDISDLVIERVIARVMEKEFNPPRDYLGMFLEAAEDEILCNGNSFIEINFDDEQKKWLRELYGRVRSMKSISEELDENAQNLFHFLFLTVGFRSVPTLDELKEQSDDLFLRYADMSVEEYKELYLQVAKEVAKEALAPKGKKAGKKAAVVKKKAAEPDEEEDEDNYPF